MTVKTTGMWATLSDQHIFLSLSKWSMAKEQNFTKMWLIVLGCFVCTINQAAAESDHSFSADYGLKSLIQWRQDQLYQFKEEKSQDLCENLSNSWMNEPLRIAMKPPKTQEFLRPLSPPLLPFFPRLREQRPTGFNSRQSSVRSSSRIF